MLHCAATITGPNNQLAGLRESLALGRLLNRTVVMTALRLHPSETTAGRGNAEYKGMEVWANQHKLIPFEVSESDSTSTPPGSVDWP